MPLNWYFFNPIGIILADEIKLKHSYQNSPWFCQIQSGPRTTRIPGAIIFFLSSSQFTVSFVFHCHVLLHTLFYVFLFSFSFCWPNIFLLPLFFSMTIPLVFDLFFILFFAHFSFSFICLAALFLFYDVFLWKYTKESHR